MKTGGWLFVNGGECIWIQRQETPAFSVVMHGPSLHRRAYTFGDEVELQTFLSDIEERLVHTGWSLQRFDDGSDRRREPDRRTAPRAAGGRRGAR